MHSKRDLSFMIKDAVELRMRSVVRRSASTTALWISSVWRDDKSNSGLVCRIFRRGVQFSCSSGRVKMVGMFGSVLSLCSRDSTR